MTSSMDELNLRLIYRACEAVHTLEKHFEDEGNVIYRGRVKAIRHQLDNLGRDERLRQAQAKEARRRISIAKRSPPKHVHELFG